MLISVAPLISVGNAVRIIKTNTIRQMREWDAFLEKKHILDTTVFGLMGILYQRRG